MKKIIISIFILCLGIGLLPQDVLAYGYAEEITQTEDFDYYSYQSEKVIFDSIDKTKGVNEWKKLDALSRLETDGYFNLKTRAEKKKYLRQNFRNSPFLSVFQKAEKQNQWNIPPQNSAQMNAQTSQGVQSSLEKRSNDSSQYWSEVRARILNQCGRTGGKNDLDLGGYNFPPTPPFGKKACWSGAELARFYDTHPEWRANLNRSQFTNEELRYLGLVDRAVVNRDDKKIRVTDDDLLLTLPLQNGALWAITKSGGKLPAKYLARVAAEEAEKQAGGFVARATAFGDSIIVRFKNRFFNIVWDLRTRFARSGFTQAERERALEAIETALSRVSNSRTGLSRYYTNAEDRPYIDSVIRSLNIRRLGRGFKKGRYIPGYFSLRDGIVLDELVMKGERLDQFGRYLFIHELTHAATYKIGLREGVRYYSVTFGGYPLGEGVTEMFTREFMMYDYGVVNINFNNSYDGVTRVARILEYNLGKKLGNTQAGRDFLADCYFNQGLNHIDDVLGPGVHDHLHCLLEAKQYGPAMDYLNSLVP